MKVLVTGIGGELGTRVAMLLEHEPAVEELAGIDVDPPRRRLLRTAFSRVDPTDRHRTADVVRRFGPHAVVHVGVYEPDARFGPRFAAARTGAAASAVLGAAEAGPLELVVVRSGIEVYGRRRGAVTVPDETVPCRPSSGFGRTLAEVEATASAAGRRSGAAVAILRLAPVVGPHVPSPLGRLLRLPVVPVSALADPPFALLHQGDAARAVVHALLTRMGGVFNVVGDGAVTASQAARLGSRIPAPVAGPAWFAARRLCDLAGAPVPDHVLEVLRRGRTADGSAAGEVLGFHPAWTTPAVVRALYEWAPVMHLRPAEGAA